MTKTETQIRALKIEATRRRDFALVRLCDAALTGDDFASRVCLAAINEALPSALDVEIMLRTASPDAHYAAPMVAVAGINSAGIRALAAAAGLTHIAMVGEGESEGDGLVRFWAMGDTYVAQTNGDPVERESDPDAFDELAEECGVDLV